MIDMIDPVQGVQDSVVIENRAPNEVHPFNRAGRCGFVEYPNAVALSL